MRTPAIAPGRLIIKIAAASGKRISDFMIGGKPIDMKKTYRVSSWGGNLQNVGENLDEKIIRPVYEVVSDYIRKKKLASA